MGRPGLPIATTQPCPRETCTRCPQTYPVPTKLHCWPGHKATLMADATLKANLAGA